LGIVVLAPGDRNARLQIIDGQQRLTTLTLLLIYLARLASERSDCPLSQAHELIVSERYSERTLNLDLGHEAVALEGLVQGRELEIEDRSASRLLRSYKHLGAIFPRELQGAALPYFMDWLIGNVELLIVTASEKYAHEISETTSDTRSILRGRARA
jgi:hypothetical protein